MLSKSKLRAAPLADAPQVDALLARLGLGAFDPGDVEACAGRNVNWAGRTTTGARVFVKRLDGEPAESGQRYARVVDLESIARTVPELRIPRLLGADEEHRLLAFEWLADGRAGNALAKDGAFTEELAYRAGRLVGALHGAAEAADSSPHPLPPTGALRAIPLGLFSVARVAELKFWRLLQQDEPLVRALEELRDQERSGVALRPCHGDLRLDQFLLDGAELYLLDWEEFRMADPARDVGAFAGEWLSSAIRKVNEDLGEDLTHEQVVARGTAEIARVRPLVARFFRGYADSGVPIDPGLAERATAYAGWHLLDRLLAAAGTRVRLRAVDLAAAGVGRTALLDPAAFVATLGLTG